MAYEYALPKGTVLRHKSLIGKESVYFIKDTLGQGGFGITYLASRTIKIGNTPHEILFAIKEFFVKGQCWRENGSSQMKYSPAAKSEVDECRKEFIDEANRLNKICSKNANIVNVNEVFEANDTAYYVMEFLSGRSLRDKILKLKGPLQEKEALAFIIPIAESIEYIHSEYRLLHCDISPDNIMLRDNSDGTFTPVLIDFGVSLHFNSKGELTTTHNAIGAKDGYAPQEQYRGVASFDSRIDIYALGATLFYLLTGKNPISSFDISQEYIDKNLPNHLSENIREAILHAMAKDKEVRTRTAKEFVSALREGSQEPPHDPKSRTLPIGYTLYSGSSKAYAITAILEHTPFFVRYKAERVSIGTSQHTSNATRRARCDVYEYFDQTCHQRKENFSLISISDLSVSQQQFLSFCADKAGNALSVASWYCDDVRWDAFKLNNTFYLVDTHVRKPLPWKKILTYCISVLLALFLCFASIVIYKYLKEIRVKEPQIVPGEVVLEEDEHNDSGLNVNETDVELTLSASKEDNTRDARYQELLSKARQNLNKNLGVAEQAIEDIISLEKSYADSAEVRKLQNRIATIKREQEREKELARLKERQEQAYIEGVNLYNAWSRHKRLGDESEEMIEKRRQAALKRINEADMSKVQKMLDILNSNK